MAARRRLADTLLLNWIVTLSLLLILAGLVTFLVFLTTPGADRWTEAGRLVGATLFQVGAVTLLLELVHLERLLCSKVPEALLEGGYLEHLKEDRLDDLIERVIQARFRGMDVHDLRLGRDWLLQSLSAPSRRDYTVTLELKRDDPVAEPFPDAAPAGDDVLCVQITYEYVTDTNTTGKPVLTNGDEGRLLLAFDVRCAHLVLPGERVKVTYRHREYVDRRGYFPWRATARTHNLRVKTIGFEGFDTYPIPSPSLPSEDDKLEVFDNGIY